MNKICNKEKVLLLFIMVTCFYVPHLSGLVIFTDGFESGDNSSWTGGSGTPIISTTHVHSGSYALYADDDDYLYKDIGAENIVYIQYYFYATAMPSAGNYIVIAQSKISGGYSPVRTGIENIGGTYYFRFSVAAANSSYVIGDISGEWHSVIMKVDSVGNVAAGYFDGVLVYDAVEYLASGCVGTTVGVVYSLGAFAGDVWIDDVTISDTLPATTFTDNVNGIPNANICGINGVPIASICGVNCQPTGGGPLQLLINSPNPEWYNGSTVEVEASCTGNTSTPYYNVYNETAGAWVYLANQTVGTPASGLADCNEYTLHVWADNETSTTEQTTEFRIDSDGYKAKGLTVPLIEAAINEAHAAGGNQAVYLPSGTLEMPDPWNTINIYEGISLIGALYDDDGTGNVTLWRTTFVVNTNISSPYGDPEYFITLANYLGGDYPTNNRSLITRISGIRLTGYRAFDSTGNLQYNMYRGIYLRNINQFRIDHCCLNNTGGSGFNICPTSTFYGSRGVIDHNLMFNDNGSPYGTGVYGTETLGYGVAYSITYPYWEPPWDNQTFNYLGQYTNNTLFFEDNTVRGWRHVISSNSYVNYVTRNNVVLKGNWAYSIWDAHGGINSPDLEATRTMEVYNNIHRRPNGIYNLPRYIHYRGGGGVVFNETAQDLLYFTSIKNDIDYAYPERWSRDIYIDLTSCTLVNVTNNVQHEGPPTNYTVGLPDGYIPYTYPHPLTTVSQCDGFAGYNTKPRWFIPHSNHNITVTYTDFNNPAITWDIVKQIICNTTTAGAKCGLKIELYDDHDLKNSTITHNTTGVFQNITNTYAGAADKHEIIDETVTNPAAGTVVAIRVWAYDNEEKVAITPWMYYTTTP